MKTVLVKTYLIVSDQNLSQPDKQKGTWTTRLVAYLIFIRLSSILRESQFCMGQQCT